MSRRHARPGTFDESAFIDPATGRFQLPKYRHDPSYLVRITDRTDWKSDLWDDLSRRERERFTIVEFECLFSGADFEVDDFESFFRRLPKRHFADMGFMKAKWDLVENVLDPVEGMEEGALLDPTDNIDRLLIDRGLMYVVVARSVEARRARLNEVTFARIRDSCKRAGVVPGRTKSKTIEHILQMEDSQLDLPVQAVPGPLLYEWIDSLVAFYISEIRRNADRFHPLLIESVWESAIGENLIGKVCSSLKVEKESGYWRDRLASVPFE